MSNAWWLEAEAHLCARDPKNAPPPREREMPDEEPDCSDDGDEGDNE